MNCNFNGFAMSLWWRVFLLLLKVFGYVYFHVCFVALVRRRLQRWIYISNRQVHLKYLSAGLWADVFLLTFIHTV